ncbi:Kelch domain-containing protein 10 [Thelohanellus kitauei]|uniref:Kelch domain-containing protein 10 n=1 Tax=Thelohanellus kitauei TaxID=669202 RepID=A0A0C2MX04_THEKT|nr:Kelch domain-containing protein 10 [Thelohanellus kitauei]
MNCGEELKEPSNRSDYCMTSAREFIIMYGGYDDWSWVAYNELWTYNTINGIWKRYHPPIKGPNACIHSSICSVGNLVYIFGGTVSPDSCLSSNSLISFDVGNATWKIFWEHTDDYDQNTPPPMIESCIFHHNGSLYVLGGLCNDDYLESMFKFCLKTSKWSVVPQNGLKPPIQGRILGTVFMNQ